MERLAEIENISYPLSESQIREAARKFADLLQEEIDRGHRFGAFVILLSFAAVVDFWEVVADFFLIGPFIGWLVNNFCSFVLWYFMKKQGWWLQRKIGGKINKYQLQITFWIISLINGVPIIDILKAAVFVDTGNVWAKASDYGNDGLKSGTGVGLRVKTPIGPINLDYGIPLDDEPGEEKRSGKFYFSVSRGF